MSDRCKQFSTRRRRAMTLVEVVGGLAILGTLLVALLVARDRYTRQWVRAQQRVEMVKAADGLLSAWWVRPDDFPRRAAGNVGDFAWRTGVAINPAVARLDCEAVRLQVFDRRDPAAVPVTVDVVLPATPLAAEVPR